jgi:hypothetical protein
MTIEDVDEHRWPERVPPAAHPTQGLRWSVLERIRRRRGGGLNALFLKRAK